MIGLAPKRSARKPPRNFPRNTDDAGSTKSSVVLLSNNGVYAPTTARMTMETKQRNITRPGKEIFAEGRSKSA